MRTEEARKRLKAQSLNQISGEDNPLWKAEAVSYRVLHRWVERHKTKTGSCSACEEETATQWASLTHEYKRDLDEFVELCAGCHGEYDFLMGWRAKPPGWRQPKARAA